MSSRKELFAEVCSTDFLKFKFGGRGYQEQLYDSIAKTQRLAGVKVELLDVAGEKIVWVQHDFGFLGGSLGCAEGEKITRSFEYAIKEGLPVCVQVRILFRLMVISVLIGRFFFKIIILPAGEVVS